MSPVGSFGIRRSAPVAASITCSALIPSWFATNAIARPSGDSANSSTSHGMPPVRTRYRCVARSRRSRRWNSEPRSVVRKMPKQANDTVAYGGAQFSRDGKGIFLTTDRGSEFQRLERLDLATQRYRVLTGGIPWDVDEFALSPDGRAIAFVANQDGISALHVIEAATGAERRIPKLPTGLISGVRWRKTGGELGFTYTSARSNADAYSLHLTTGKLVRWPESEPAGLTPADLVEPELVHWTSFDGRAISGFLFRPPARFTGRRPVVVNIHGGPEGQSRPGFLGRSNFLLNELGVAVIFPNIRGSTGYGKTFVKLDNGVRRDGAYKDIGTLFDWIRARPDLDADHVLVTGGSYGGHMTLATATLYSERICCSVDVVGISNLATFLKNTSGYRQDLRRVEYGDERDSTMRAWIKRTPYTTLFQ